MPGHFVFVRFFLGYTNSFPYERVLHLEDRDINAALESLRQEWWSDPANRHRLQQARVEREQRRITLEALQGKLQPALPPGTQNFQVLITPPPDEPPYYSTNYEEIATVAGWLRPPPAETFSPHSGWRKLSSPDALPSSVSQERIAAAAVPWNTLPPLDAFAPHYISPWYPVARFDSRETAVDAATALQARVAELGLAANAQQDRDELDVLFRTANPRLFVVGGSELSRHELAITKEKLQRVRVQITGTASAEERFLRAYWASIYPTLAQFDSPISPAAAPEPGQSADANPLPAPIPFPRSSAAAPAITEGPPPSSGTDNGQDEVANADREELIQAMMRSVRLAYLAFLYAESKAGRRLEDREAHNLLTEEGIPDGAGDRGELTDYHPPNFETWSRQLREARNALGEQKYTRRAGRPTGKSIVRGSQVEQQQDPDQ